MGIGGGNRTLDKEGGNRDRNGDMGREVGIEVEMEIWEGSQHCLYEITL